jgi:hypothetical protein
MTRTLQLRLPKAEIFFWLSKAHTRLEWGGWTFIMPKIENQFVVKSFQNILD